MAQRAYDVVIIGSGPAGYTAALYAARASLKVLVFQGFESGGQLMLTSDVENYPGYRDGVMGPEMMDDFEAQAARFGAEMRPENIERVDFSERPFKLWAEDEDEATLAKFADEVFLIHRRDEFRASRIMLERARKNPKITFITDTVVEEILGKDAVEGVRTRNTKTDEERTIHVSGFFTAIGHTPATSLFEGQVEMKEGGYIIQKENTMTSVPGVFAAGDVSDIRYRQAVTAAGDGCRAAIDSERWLEEQGEAEGAEDPAVWTAEKDVANL